MPPDTTLSAPGLQPADATATSRDLADAPAFIEVQCPVSKLSKESYKERKANNGQTLTGLGKWWGRKPLVLVRAAILGLLLPATDDPAKDRETFLALMTMDDDGMLRRLKKSISPATVYTHLTPRDQRQYFGTTGPNPKPKWQPGISNDAKRRLQRLVFLRMGYDERLDYCHRPEHIDGPSPEAWAKINAHLGTNASSLPELVRELGQRRFGHTPRVADAFSGGGSIPFEAARIGCDAYGSDLNPVAALLTWAALNIVGGGPEVVERVKAAQRRVYEAVKRQVDEWGIERNEARWVADAFLYCNEVTDPITSWRVPLAPSWVIGEGTRTIARLVPDPVNRRFDIEIHQGVSPDEVAQAREEGTWRDGLRCPVDVDGNWLAPPCRQPVSAEQLRGRAGLRLWENDDLVPRPGDVFGERLYCIRWVNPTTGERCYLPPTPADLQREAQVLALLRERFAAWQQAGFIPSRRIEPGDKTDEPIRTRGWTHWHHLFSPRHLLIGGLVAAKAIKEDIATEVQVSLLLSICRLANWNSRLAMWDSSRANEKGMQTYYNQALNVPMNHVARAVSSIGTTVIPETPVGVITCRAIVELVDARMCQASADLWLTDPGYADAINYEELSEHFLAWCDSRLTELFPDWYADSKRALAVRGKDEHFRRAMVECYRNFAYGMPDNGFQLVMFTHQDAEVWSDLALVLWAAGLQVSAAWTVATETGAGGIRQGNLVQGTVLLVLRKRRGDQRGDMSDLYPEVQAEVRRQLESMLALDPKEDPNFGDADYQLAAYAAALRVVTAYASIDEIDVERELYRPRKKGERSPLTGLIERAVRIASDFLVPDGLDRTVWRRLAPEERLYLKGVEVEAHGEQREGVYQEFARGFGVVEYRGLLASGAANQTRLRTPSELRNRDLKGSGFAGSLLRLVLFAVFKTVEAGGDPEDGRRYLRDELPDYWDKRVTILALLRYLANKPVGLPHWQRDAEAASLLLGRIEHDAV